MVQNDMFCLNMEKEYIYIIGKLLYMELHGFQNTLWKNAKANMSHLDDSSLSCA